MRDRDREKKEGEVREVGKERGEEYEGLSKKRANKERDRQKVE